MENEQITLDDKITCLMQEMGKNLGEVLRCMIASEIANHTSRILQLQSVLNGETCVVKKTPNVLDTPVA